MCLSTASYYLQDKAIVSCNFSGYQGNSSASTNNIKPKVIVPSFSSKCVIHHKGRYNTCNKLMDDDNICQKVCSKVTMKVEIVIGVTTLYAR